MPTHLEQIAVYPIKGFPAWRCNQTEVKPGAILPYDRRFGCVLQESLDRLAAKADSEQDPSAVGWLSKRHLLQIFNTAPLSGFQCDYQQDGEALTVISQDGEPFPLDEPEGRARFEALVTDLFGKPVRLLDGQANADGAQAFADQKRSLISLLNQASVEDMAERSGKPVDWQRMRGNLMLRGWEAWYENELVGETLLINGTGFEVVELIGRCAAPGVNLQGQKDLDLLDFMLSTYGHTDCGLFLAAKDVGTFAVRDAVIIA